MMNIVCGLGIALVAGFIGYVYGLLGSKELVSVEDVQESVQKVKNETMELLEKSTEQTARALEQCDKLKAELEVARAIIALLEEPTEEYDNVINLDEYRNRR